MRVPSLPKKVAKVLREVLAIPTAPFSEHLLAAHLIKRFKSNPRISIKSDAAGNLLASYKPKRGASLPVCFQAHLDHPGFEFVRTFGKGRGYAEAFGGVPEQCAGCELIFYARDGSGPVKAKVVSFMRRGGRKLVRIAYKGIIQPGSFAMWNFHHFKERGLWIEGRSFDDTLGTALLTALLENASGSGFPFGFQVLFTRAEEVGYNGALEIMRLKSFKLPPYIVTVEMPRAGESLRPGEGVMLRSGDRMMDFSPQVGLVLTSIAKRLTARHAWFRSQRSLGLLGGTECSVFQLYGHRVGAVCLPVVNAHNRHDVNGRAAPEKVHRGDLLSLWKMLLEIAGKPWRPEEEVRELAGILQRRAQKYRTKLRKTVKS